MQDQNLHELHVVLANRSLLSPGHNSIKVTLDSYGTIIDELMLKSVRELKEKLSPNKVPDKNVMPSNDTDAQADLIKKSNKISLS